MEEQRGKVARLIGARNDEIIFTSSGAEANNLAIKGMALATFQKRGKHLIVSAIEHHSVLNSARFLEKFFDFEVTFYPWTDTAGLIQNACKKPSPRPRSWFPLVTAATRSARCRISRNWWRCAGQPESPSH